MTEKETSLHPDTFKRTESPREFTDRAAAESKAETKKTPKGQSLEPGTVEWEEERIRLSDDVKKAQAALWDHSHPVIEDPQVVADKEAAEERKSQAKAAKK